MHYQLVKGKMKPHHNYVMHTSDLQKCRSLTISSAAEPETKQWERLYTADGRVNL